MTAPFKLRAALPVGDDCGLGTIDGLTAVIALVEPSQRLEDLDTNETVTTLRVDRIEQVDGTDARLIRDMLRRYREARTGVGALALVDPQTGEIG